MSFFSKMKNLFCPKAKKAVSKDDSLREFLKQHGIVDVKEIVYNPSYDELFKEEIREDLQGFEKGIHGGRDGSTVGHWGTSKVRKNPHRRASQEGFPV